MNPRKRSREKSAANKSHSEEYQRFEKLAEQLISVPKSEIDKTGRVRKEESCQKTEGGLNADRAPQLRRTLDA